MATTRTTTSTPDGGDNLARRALVECGLTHDALAWVLCVSRGTVTRWAAGDATAIPGPVVVALDALLGGDLGPRVAEARARFPHRRGRPRTRPDPGEAEVAAVIAVIEGGENDAP